MPEAVPSLPILRFGVFELDLRAGELRKQGLKIRLQEKPLQVLALLLDHPGQVVTREELRQQLWAGDTFVDFDHGINTAIKKLREALGDSAESPRFIETLPRHGYRFIGHVEPLGSVRTPPTSEAPHSASAEAGLSLVAKEPPMTGQAPAERGNSRRQAVGAGIAAIVVVGMLFAFNVAGLRSHLLSSVGASHGVPLPKIESIAVLPLENLSGDPEQEYFADGMTEELIADLGQISALRVISRTSVMRYKDTKKPLPEIARELHVDAVVEGAVLLSGNRVRITANLLYAPTDRHLWAQTYQRDLGDVIVLQSEVARAIASQIRIKLAPQEHARLAATRPVNPEAYRLYLEGRYYFFKTTIPAFEKSIQLFQRAIEKDPNCALAYAGLSESYNDLAGWGPALPKTVIPKARVAARKAIELDSTLAEAHLALGYVLFYHDWDWSATEHELKRAIELKPGYAVAHQRYAWYLSAIGRHEQAFAEMRRAEELDPVSPPLRIDASALYYHAGRYDEAIEEARKGIELDPNFRLGHSWLAWGYLGKEMPEKAMPEFEEWARLSGYDATRRANILSMQRAWVYAVAGKRAEALKMLPRLKKQFDKEGLPPVHFIALCAALGEKQTALELLENAYEERDSAMTLLNVKIWWDPIRTDPRFQALLRRMNFPP